MSQEVVLDEYAFLVSETDLKGIIKFANEDFCRVARYQLNELIGQPHNIVRHEDMPKSAFKSLWATIKQDKIWTGYVKNARKDGGYYWVFATVYPFQSCDGTKGYLSCRRRASKREILKHTALYQTLKEKEE